MKRFAALMITLVILTGCTGKRAEMEKNMAALGIRDAAERIYQTILEITR